MEIPELCGTLQKKFAIRVQVVPTLRKTPVMSYL